MAFPLNPTLVGLAGGALTTGSALPQIVHSMRTRNVQGLSPWTLGLFAAGLALWLVYGIQIKSLPVIFWNATSLGLYIILIAIRIRYHEAMGGKDLNHGA
jgi:MtN3 and saliva related transmembrane protein